LITWSLQEEVQEAGVSLLLEAVVAVEPVDLGLLLDLNQLLEQPTR
jgi:hypothetical protein